VEANVVLDYLKGLLSGAALVTVGLAVVSQSTLPQRQAPAEAALESEAADTAAKTDADEAGAEAKIDAGDLTSDATDGQAEVASQAPAPAEEPAALDGQQAQADEPLLRPMTEPEAPPIAAIAPDLQTNAAGAPSDLPISDAAPAPAREDATTQPAAEAAAETVPQTTEETGPETTPETVPETAPEMTAEAVPEVAQAGGAEAELPTPSTLIPDSGLEQKTVEGVTTGRLPTITPEPAEETVVASAETSPAEPSEVGTEVPEIAVDLPPLQRFARSFKNPGAKPLFAILLVDSGDPELQRAELAALPLPLSFVVDPMQSGAAEAAAIYRAAGQEVVMLATAIPKGATAADLEQSFAAVTQILPEAVALIDTSDATFQDNRGLSAEVVTHLDAKGLGLVTFDRGLNAADQVARREGLPSAIVFRSLDDEGEDSPLIRRYLDRAAFKAAQEGRVVVIGTAREATITALMEWAVEGRSASVALAPISAVMQAP
jgi:polysaccharide deacetylase 2 family uncharacterized protein YibQ